jgi:hyperosmotically inducible protein
VDDQVEVLPLSPFDDNIRIRTLRGLERTGSLYRYFMGVNPSIRIVVKNGHVTLDGIVQNSMDRQMAYMAANGISGVFSVTNDLSIAPKL